MQQKSINIFVTLLENLVVTEASTSASIIGRIPGGKTLITYMHKNMDLAHDQQYEEVKKLSWSELKSKNTWNNAGLSWVLVKGKEGFGAISATDSYQALAVYDGEVVQKRDERGGNIIDWLKGYIGPIQSYYVGKSTGEVRKKKVARTGAKPVPTEQFTDIPTFTLILMKKFKPLWIKAVEAAQADIKGFLGTQLKNNAYDKADKKIARLKALDKVLSALDDGKNPTTDNNDRYDDPFVIMKHSLHNAILMAAHHYYPDMTRGFQDRSRSYGRTSMLNDSSAVLKLFNDIRNGDTSKLGTILGFFKKGLISG